MHFLTDRLMDPDGAAGIPELVFQVRDKKYTAITADMGTRMAPHSLGCHRMRITTKRGRERGWTLYYRHQPRELG